MIVENRGNEASPETEARTQSLTDPRQMAEVASAPELHPTLHPSSRVRPATAGQGFGAGDRRRGHDPARVARVMAREALEARGWVQGQDFLQDGDGMVTVLTEALRVELEQRRGHRRG